jgi:hypothetical protein
LLAKPLTPFQAFQLLVPILQAETPKSYAQWQPRFEHQLASCVIGGPPIPDCTLIADAFGDSVVDDFINELFSKQRFGGIDVRLKDLMVMAILCAYTSKQYEVVRHLVIRFCNF